MTCLCSRAAAWRLIRARVVVTVTVEVWVIVLKLRVLEVLSKRE